MKKEDFLNFVEKKKELKKLFDSFENELLDKAIEVLQWKNDNGQKLLKGWEYTLGYQTRIKDIYDNEVEIKVHETWAYGGEEDHYYDVSFDELLSDDWKEEFLLKVENKKKEIEAKKEQEKLDKETKEKELLAKLKAKYEV